MCRNKGKSLKESYMKLVDEEKVKIWKEIESYQNQLSLLEFNKSNVEKMVEEVEQSKGKIEKNQKNKLENFK